MARAPLHLVVDNKPENAPSSTGRWVTPEEAAKIDFEALGAHALYALTMLKLILLAPLQLIARIWRICIATAIGVVRGTIRLIVGAFGLALIAWFAFAMIRVIFHPLFAHYAGH